MSGTEKLTPIVIGKSTIPACLRGINKMNLGVYYRKNKKARMTEIIWKEWLLKIDKKFKRKNRKILLFVDNFSGHHTEVSKTLTNVQLMFFPANCTSKLQPLDQGIIAVYKHAYRTTDHAFENNRSFRQ